MPDVMYNIHNDDNKKNSSLLLTLCYTMRYEKKKKRGRGVYMCSRSCSSALLSPLDGQMQGEEIGSRSLLCRLRFLSPSAPHSDRERRLNESEFDSIKRCDRKIKHYGLHMYCR